MPIPWEGRSKMGLADGVGKEPLKWPRHLHIPEGSSDGDWGRLPEIGRAD